MKLTTKILQALIEAEIGNSLGGSDIMASRAASEESERELDKTQRIIQLIRTKVPQDDPHKMKYYSDRLRMAKTPEEKDELLKILSNEA